MCGKIKISICFVTCINVYKYRQIELLLFKNIKPQTSNLKSY